MENQKARKIIDNYIKNKEFINVSDFDSFANLIIIISYKGTGKSYSALKKCVDGLKKGEQFAVIRNTEKELNLSRVKDSITALLAEENLLDKFHIRDDGVYQYDKNNKLDKGILMGIFCTMNKPFNTASQNALNNVKTIVYDEFINPDFTKQNLFADFMKMAHTLIRKNYDAKIYLLGNKHEANNDILNELAIEFDWENPAIQIEYLPEQHCIALYLPRWEIDKMEKANKLITSFCLYSPSMNNFNAGKISNNNMRGVFNWTRNKLADKFTPLFKFDLLNVRFCAGTIYVGETKIGYIKQMDFNSEFENFKIPIICFLSNDVLPDNRLVLDSDNQYINFLLKNYQNGNLYFSSAFGLEQFNHLKSFYKALFDGQNKLYQ